MKKRFSFKILLKNFFAITTLILILGMIPSAPEEGMYPVTEINKLELKKAGLKIDVENIFNPGGISLVDALVRLPGCTGSFVSKNGLIVTNHHCAYGEVNRVSTPEENHLKNGFLAKSLDEEIPLRGYFIRIAESYEDVSNIILKNIDEIDDHAERAKEIAKRRRELEKKYTDDENAIDAEVSEMFVGKTYVLIKYKILKDVRLVYIPPITIGNFGGETDNWMWPRHTGDFSFYRVYVAPDGSSAEFSEDNIPLKPKKYIIVNPDGVDEGDFVFVLGYPARTFRHRPWQYIKFQEDYQLSYIQQLYGWTIDLYEKLAKGNPELEFKYATPIKRLANTEKNFRGKLMGLKKLQLVNQKQEEEKTLQSFIDSDPELKNIHGSLLNDIDNVYKDLFRYGLANLWFSQLERRSGIYQAGELLISFAMEMTKSIDDRDPRFDAEELSEEITEISEMYNDFDYPFERAFFEKMLFDAARFDETEHIAAVDELFSGSDSIDNTISDFLDNTVMNSKLLDKEFFLDMIEKTSEEILSCEDPFFLFVKRLVEQHKKITDLSLITTGKLNKLSAQLIDVKSIWRKTSFVPDANYSLRLTYGYIRGYDPVDAVHYNPVSTLDGVIEKNLLGNPDYKIPDKLRELYDNKDFGRFYDEKLGSIPTGILYNMDTSGGNSGSPILDAYGRLVGLNFDRAFEATINDFAWNEAYSRSIGVDIRYILWIAHKFSCADNLVKELGVEL
ncbi:S46 family peptidase [Bacteroidota bacterium]